MKKIIFICMLICGCSSNVTTNQANPCATKGATYLGHAVQESGNCGDAPDQIINVGSDGTLDKNVSCARITQDGCTACNSDCTFGSNGVTCTATTDVTFAYDGSSAHGLESISCYNSVSSCASTYVVTLIRQ